ncbi:MAG: hypothetical protein ACTSR0_04095 [Candidatus Asgardarchaeia archaeon]
MSYEYVAKKWDRLPTSLKEKLRAKFESMTREQLEKLFERKPEAKKVYELATGKKFVEKKVEKKPAPPPERPTIIPPPKPPVVAPPKPPKKPPAPPPKPVAKEEYYLLLKYPVLSDEELYALSDEEWNRVKGYCMAMYPEDKLPPNISVRHLRVYVKVNDKEVLYRTESLRKVGEKYYINEFEANLEAYRKEARTVVEGYEEKRKIKELVEVLRGVDWSKVKESWAFLPDDVRKRISEAVGVKIEREKVPPKPPIKPPEKPPEKPPTKEALISELRGYFRDLLETAGLKADKYMREFEEEIIPNIDLPEEELRRMVKTLASRIIAQEKAKIAKKAVKVKPEEERRERFEEILRGWFAELPPPGVEERRKPTGETYYIPDEATRFALRKLFPAFPYQIYEVPPEERGYWGYGGYLWERLEEIISNPVLATNLGFRTVEWLKEVIDLFKRYDV